MRLSEFSRNLSKLFEIQKTLDNRIVEKHGLEYQNLLTKKVLALLVELGECANEYRVWKFWSTDREPRTEVLIECDQCGGSGKTYVGYCGGCHGGYVGKENLLLEEYVDGLHFVLGIGIEHGIDKDIAGLAIEDIKFRSIEEQFIALFKADWEYCKIGDGGYYHEGLELFISLGEMLGFTWEQIETAYLDKNKVNHERQNNGY